MKYNYLIIDGNNLYARNWYVNSSLTCELPNNTKVITGGVFGFLRSLFMLKREYMKPLGKIYIIFDGNYLKRDKARKKIDKNYKANRNSDKVNKGYYEMLDYLKGLLLKFDNLQKLFHKHNYEADDVVLPVIKSILKKDKKNKVLLISDDLDWCRALVLSNRINILSKNKVINRKGFKEKYGFEIKNDSLILYKCFRGDKSDNIPIGVPRIRENILVKLIIDYSNLDKLLTNVNKIDYLNDKWKKEIIKNKDRLLKNYKLVDYIHIKESIEKISVDCKLNKKKLKAYYNELCFSDEFDSRIKE
jgi:5'-3' exonuclease